MYDQEPTFPFVLAIPRGGVAVAYEVAKQLNLPLDVIVIKSDPHSKEEFQRRCKMPFGEEDEVFTATPEDVIIKKLIYFRECASEKHITDIQGILANQKIDQNYLDRWIKELHLENEWKKTC